MYHFSKTNGFIDDYKRSRYLKLIHIQGKTKCVLKYYEEMFDKIKYSVEAKYNNSKWLSWKIYENQK